MDYAVIVNLPDHKRGDHWPPVLGSTPGRLSIGPVLIDGNTPSAPLDRLRFKFKSDRGKVFIIDSEDTEERSAPLIIDNPETWEAHVPEIEHFLPASGVWEWDAEAFDASRQTPLTIYKGSITVLPDV